MWFVEVLKNSILITGLVMVMMFLIEYIHVFSQGHSLERLRNRPLLQIVMAALLGFVPGCGGGFVVVSLYAHNMVSFGALVAMMVATLGDESFLMLAMMPKTAILIALGLLFGGIVVGWLTDKTIKNVQRPFGPDHYVVHEQADHVHGTRRIWGRIGPNFKPLHWQRGVILAALALFFVAIAFGFLEHDHAHEAVDDHAHVAGNVFDEHWINMVFAVLALITLFLTLWANNHFVEEHLWNHTIKHHFLRIFLWTFGGLLVIEGALHFIDLSHLIQDQFWIMLAAAVLIGLIPESGPHILFISLYAGGAIPLSILLANCIVQDGHAGLPLLAETKKGFVIAKALKVVVGVAVALLFQFAVG